MSDEIKNNPAIFIDKETFMKSRFTIDQGESEAILNKVWEDIKAGR